MSKPRLRAILDVVRQAGVVSVEELVQRFAVTPQTIRKDLNQLCEQRWLERTHGGARLATSIDNMSYAARRMLAASAKRAIGETVASLIPDNASLFINIGTTTEAVAHALSQHRRLMVITNNLNVAAILRAEPACQVLVAGGEVRAADGGIVGETAVEFIRQFKVDYAVVGASAIDEDGSLLDFDIREVQVSQAILANARHVILAADASKQERSAPVRIGHFSQVHSFVTDRLLHKPLGELLEVYGVRLVETGRARTAPVSPLFD